LFLLLATGVVNIGGKFTSGVVDTGRKLPPVSTTLAKLMAKFAVGVVDTGPPVSLIPVVHLDLRISQIF